MPDSNFRNTVNATAIYLRVSSTGQDVASQLPDVDRWAAAEGIKPARYVDHETGKTLQRPAWRQLEADISAGKIRRVVVWRLDRLGRTAAGLTALFRWFRERRVAFLSLKDSLDLDTAAGRLMANVLASVAEYETEVRSERQLAGIAVAKSKGVYRGRKPGTTKGTPDRALELRQRGLNQREIASALGVSVRTVARYLRSG